MAGTDGRHGWQARMAGTDGRRGCQGWMVGTDGRHGWQAWTAGTDGRHGWQARLAARIAEVTRWMDELSDQGEWWIEVGFISQEDAWVSLFLGSTLRASLEDRLPPCNEAVLHRS